MWKNFQAVSKIDDKKLWNKDKDKTVETVRFPKETILNGAEQESST